MAKRYTERPSLRHSITLASSTGAPLSLRVTRPRTVTVTFSTVIFSCEYTCATVGCDMVVACDIKACARSVSTVRIRLMVHF